MRISLLALVIPLAAGTLDAQRLPARRNFSTRPPMLQTVTVDIASAFQQRYRATIEPLVFGRFTLGLSGEYTTEPDMDGVGVIAYPDCPIERPCASTADGRSDGYRAWSFDVHARWYPRVLSYEGQRQSVALYLGEFVGYHERRTTQLMYYGCPGCETPPPLVTDDPSVPQPIYAPSSFTQILRGWEPGAEAGVRVTPMRHVVMDIGARFRLARLDDYQSSLRPGDVDTRLVVSFGVGW